MYSSSVWTCSHWDKSTWSRLGPSNAYSLALELGAGLLGWAPSGGSQASVGFQHPPGQGDGWLVTCGSSVQGSVPSHSAYYRDGRRLPSLLIHGCDSGFFVSIHLSASLIIKTYQANWFLLLQLAILLAKAWNRQAVLQQERQLTDSGNFSSYGIWVRNIRMCSLAPRTGARNTYWGFGSAQLGVGWNSE